MRRKNHSGPIAAILLYGLLLGVLLVAFKLFEYSYFSHRITLDIYLGIIAVVFLLVGIIVGVKGRGKSEKQEGQEEKGELGVPLAPALPEIPPELDLSKRELEVLSHLMQGRTNQEIAEALFLSPNTVKTHLSNIYRKLDVERRTQAIARARELQIVR